MKKALFAVGLLALALIAGAAGPVVVSVGVANITGLGTSVATALGVNVGTSGAVLVKGTSASTDLSDTTAATTFVPTDTSGAALSFTSVSGNFGKSNKTCVGQFGLTFPSTASGSAAQISLPSACTIVTGANTVIGGCRSTAASPRSTLMLFGLGNSTNAQFLATDTLTPTNANMTTVVLNCNFAYITN